MKINAIPQQSLASQNHFRNTLLNVVMRYFFGRQVILARINSQSYIPVAIPKLFREGDSASDAKHH